MIYDFETFCEMYERSNQGLHSLIRTFRERNGKDPDWLINGEYINTDIMFKWDNIIQRCWIYNTDPDGIYFNLMDIFKQEAKIGAELAKRSKVFKSKSAWTQFINQNLFSLRDFTLYEKKYHQQIDFLYIGVQILREYNKGQINDNF